MGSISAGSLTVDEWSIYEREGPMKGEKLCWRERERRCGVQVRGVTEAARGIPWAPFRAMDVSRRDGEREARQGKYTLASGGFDQSFT